MINPEIEKTIADIAKSCKQIKPVAVVRCITFNHELFIREALDSILNQETTFPFVVIVHDDASTDSTPDIIKEYSVKYPKVIFPVLETENQYSKKDGSLNKILNKAILATGAPFIALCEGDDYWITSDKLQIQVDFLLKNPEYGLCCTNYYEVENNNIINSTKEGNREITFKQLFEKNDIGTLTTCYRTEIIPQYFKLGIYKYKFPLGDYPLWLFISQKYKIYHFADYSACYRILPESASHSQNLIKQFLFRIGYYEIQILFSRNNHELNRKAKKRRIKNILYFALKRRQFKLLKYLFKYKYI